MLFNSPIFLFAFLPLTLAIFYLARTYIGGSAALLALVMASLIFYGYWSPPFVGLLVASILINYVFVRILSKRPSNFHLSAAIILNLAVLAYFKYRFFLAENLSLFFDTSALIKGAADYVIPLAISFFTFQQIALLFDVKDKRTKVDSPLDYLAFVALFPQLIAGPIVLFKEMRGQFAEIKANNHKGLELFCPGVIIFSIGLFKKVVLADSIAPYSDMAFGMVERLTTLEAWLAAIAFSLQLYFDFSGYSDMAVGLGLMLGLTLPVNFRTPFRSTSMIDFWKRWHITMTRFFMLYVYSPMALRIGRLSIERNFSMTLNFIASIAIPTLITFFLSGLWHGASWHFVMFGAVNGFALVINHAWRQAGLFRIPAFIGWILTICTVVVSFVYFRAPSIEVGTLMLSKMFWNPTLVFPNWLSPLAESLGVPWRSLAFIATGSYTLRLCIWIAIAGAASLFVSKLTQDLNLLKPTWKNAFCTATALLISVGLFDRPQAFIYFQF